jgi:phosphohistidine swiveling domain-containing protein
VADEAAAFPVHFDDPADAQLCWRYDREHMPETLSPIGFELGLSPFLQGFGWGMRPIQINYYTYFVVDQPPHGERPPSPVDIEYLEKSARRWNDEILPEVLRHIEQYRTTDFDALSGDELVREIERLREIRFRSGELHSLAVTPHWLGLTLLVDTYKKLTGGDDLGALRLAQGYRNKSVEAGEQLWHVSRVAASVLSLRDRLLKIDAAFAQPCLAELERDREAQPFVVAFRAYLDEFGWRTGGGFSSPTWFEDPTVPLTMLRTYLDLPGYDPVAEQRRLADDREAAIRDTMAQLGPEERRRLEDVLAAVRGVVTLSEDHNYYIDQRLATMPRRLLLAAGRRLVSKGVLDDPAAVFFLSTAELVEALQGETGSLQETTSRRKEELAYWRTVTPPSYVGAPPPEGERQAAPAEPPFPSADAQPGELRGLGASAGTARGPARVLTSLAQSDRLRPGDVLVAQVTQPPWTPLFAIASAIVTEVGGVLGHTAIVAREYGIPAVLSVTGATRLLRDGQLLEVDGRAGVVRILG